MKIKKYVGETTHEAMIKLKSELGPDAVVLNTKNIRRRGILGFLKKPLVEITVGYEEGDLLHNQLNKRYEAKLNSISKEISDLKRTMQENSISKSNISNLPIAFQPYYKRLVSNGVDRDLASNLLHRIKEQIKVEEKDSETINNVIKFTLAEELGTPKPISVSNGQKKIFFIGPTGVGKTTTLAKIAANLILEDKYKIGLITADTYRIGAVEQLKIYSEILQIPLEIAYNKDDIYNAYEKFEDKDILLIDTAGRSHFDQKQMEELKDILNSTPLKETYLLISGNTDYRGLNSLIEKYDFVDDYKLIITKTDEMATFGNFLNIKHVVNKEFSYCTTGQNVPDDIEIIDVDYIVNKLIEESNND